jgi:hypothetical protein
MRLRGTRNRLAISENVPDPDGVPVDDPDDLDYG